MSERHEPIHPIIMCGGSGTRLWPASRESMPKQFIKLLDEESTFQATVRRVSDKETFARPIVITASDSRFIVAEQLQSTGVEADIVLEPMRRDSAAAIAAAACYALARNPRAILLVMPADHIVEHGEQFGFACQKAAEAASRGLIMTLGVRPTFPATAYGYIAPGDRLEDSDAFAVDRFVEKPDLATAQSYIQEGYLWNAGYFLFRADVMIVELERFVPDIVAAAQAAVDQAVIDLDFVRLDEAAFARAPRTSIDYAVMEKTRQAGVLPVAFSWSDIGTWDALWDASPRDADGNTVRGPVELVATKNSLVHSDGLLTTVVGVDGVIVVTTPDAVLVTSREDAGQVKDLVSVLKAKKHREVDEHLRMYRPWGWYQRIDIGDRFQVKRIMVKPGGQLSLQKHFHRAEHWVVVRGTAEVTVDERVVLVHENEAVYLPIGCIHRLRNPGRISLELIEVQVGSYTGEDDIVRVEDVYGR